MKQTNKKNSVKQPTNTNQTEFKKANTKTPSFLHSLSSLET